MAFMVVFWIIAGCMLLVQGFHILKTGALHPFFLKPRGSRDVLSSKYMPAALFIVPSVFMFFLLFKIFLRSNKEILAHWLTSHLGGMVAGIFFTVVGLNCLLRPQNVIRTANSPYPNTKPDEENLTSRLIVRFLGACFLFFGALVLKTL